jgi:aldose 1-epimerase
MPMSQETGLRLAAGNLRAEIFAGIGGALGGFWSETSDGPVNWMRRADPAAIAAADAHGMACYPLVPFSNRIRDGRFSFDGRDIQLPLNFLPHPHVIHGHGWKARWQVAETSAWMADLEYRHEADAWPWPYLAKQRFHMSDEALTISISLTNLGDIAMPSGIGLHPHFPRDRDTTMSGSAEGFWNSDAEVMPTALVSADTVWPADTPLQVDRVALDNCFTGWGKTLDIRWPGRALRVKALGPLDNLIVFTPPGQSFFCAEPVSHIIDAANLAAIRHDTGLVALAPGETLDATVGFRPVL